AIERAAVVTNGLGDILLDITDGTIAVSGGDDDTGSDAIDAHTDGPAVAALYYPDWILQLLKGVGSDTVRLHLPDPYKPTLVTAVGPDGQDADGYRALINPRRATRTVQAAA
ncbi:hypothetical protein, partial [Nocardiopsis tropica]